MYSGYGTSFGEEGSWSFGNDFSRNVAIFVVDNKSSYHANDRNNIFLVLVEGPSDEQRKGLVSILVKKSQNFA